MNALLFYFCTLSLTAYLAAVGAFKSKSLKVYKSTSLKVSGTDDVRRSYASYILYKSKTAVAVKLIPPTWAVNPSGKSRSVSREGGMLLEFAPAVSQREYDWQRKATFLVNPTECGELIARIEYGGEFFHDPFAQSEKAGQITKKLKWTQREDKLGIFLSLTVNDKSASMPTTLSLPVSWGEFETIQTIIKFAIPRFLGFDAVWGDPGLEPMPYEVQPMPPAAPSWKNLD